MMKKMMVLFFLFVIVVSCTPPLRIEFFPGAKSYPPTAPASIDLLRMDPQRPHEALAAIRYNPPSGMSRSQVEGLLRERGAAIGADALVIEVDTVFREKVWVGPYRTLRGRRVHRSAVRDRIIEAIAIRYH
jgi:hypothetical protein